MRIGPERRAGLALAPLLGNATLIGVRTRLSFLFCVGALLLVAMPADAVAGLFGGFTSGGSYLRGSDQVCKPVTSALELPTCETQTTTRLAKLTFQRVAKQQGAKQSVVARKSASKIKLHDAQTDSLLFTWDSGQIISNTGSVFLDPSGRWVAVEFTSRLGGREVADLVVMELGNALAASHSAAPVPSTPVPSTNIPKDAVPADPPAFTAAMQLGDKWARRKKHSKAIAAYRDALAQLPEHPEALYRLARSHMAGKDKAEAVATLARISKSKHAKAVQWRVEARFDLIFKPMRGDADFRKAVGIDRGPDDPVTLYERLVAFGGRWEQAPIACEQPEVDLDLQRSEKRRFDLVIRSKCQGSTETTRLDGSWQESGDRRLGLTFPNTDSADEDLVCQVERCSDDSGEDCLRCQLDKDIEILLRVVRR